MKVRVKKTEKITINSADSELEAIDRAASILLGGGVIGFPAETIYGLGVDATNPSALKLLRSIKKRDEKKPISILIPGKKDLGLFTSEISSEAERLIDRFWPGPLTIVFKAAEGLSDILTGGTGTVGVRVPGSRLCLSLLKKTGAPMTAPSANPQGKTPAETADMVLEYFEGSIDLVIDGGKSALKKPSTVIDSTKEDMPVIREGQISTETIRNHLLSRQ